MPEVELQRRPDQGTPWWAWLLGALVVFGLIWWAITATMGPREVAQVPQGPPEQTARAAAAALPVTTMRTNPNQYIGQSVTGMGTVAEVITDHAFWVEQNGERLLVVKDALIAMPELQPGQQVSLEGFVRDPKEMAQIPGMTDLEERTRTTLQAEPVFIHASAIEAQSA